MRCENSAVRAQQVGALHPLAPRTCTDQHPDVRAGEGDIGIVGDVDGAQQGKRAVFELHRDAFGSGHGGGNLEQSKFDRYVSAEHLPRSYAEKHAVGDLTRRSGHRDGYGRNTHCRLLTCRFHDCPFYNAVRTVSTLVE
jgi:hypothetical protein